MTFTNRVLAITGGASGIGFATAQEWVSQGGHAVLLDINEAALPDAVQRLGGDSAARGVACDITSRESVDAAIASIAHTEGRLDALLNGAGIARPAPSSEVTDEDFTGLIDIHLIGAVRTARAAHGLLAESHGSVVNISSVAGRSGMPKRASYCAAKSALEGLTRTLAVEWAPDGIRVNAIAPGYTATAFTEKLIAEGKLRTEGIEARTPLRRFARPEEIAGPIAFLFSDAASYITGHTLVVDGGMTVDGDWY